MSEASADSTRTWSDSRRAAHERRNGSADYITIPLVLPGRGHVGSIVLPMALSEAEFAHIERTIGVYRPALTGE